MRLTLRTLLSYLDNVLDEPSRAALQKQIDASEHASEWIYRTRDVTRRLKLGAPEPEGTGSVDDPNTVAEYLDRTLPEESVAEFERVCLESDAMLAEVASCHKVLAMVLSEPPSVDSDTRDRLHRLQEELDNAMKSRIETAHPSPSQTPSQEQPTAAADEPSEKRIKPPVGVSAPPLAGPSTLAQWLPAIAALLLLCATAFLTLRQPQQVAEVKPKPVIPTKPPKQELQSGQGGSVEESESTNPDSPAPEQPVVDPSEPQPVPTEPIEAASEAESTELSPPQEEEADSVIADPVVVDPPAEGSMAEVPSESSDVEEPVVSTEPIKQAEPDLTIPDVEIPSEQASSESMATEQVELPEEPAEPETPAIVGTLLYAGPPGSFAAVETIDGPWVRLAPGMETGDLAHVVNMPTYRSLFELSTGVVVELVGQSEVRINPANSAIELLYGRVLFSAADGREEPAQFNVLIDGVSHAATLGVGARMAIAADRFHQIARDTRSGSPQLVVVAHSFGGEVTWESEGATQIFTEPKETFYVENFGSAPPEFVDTAWIDSLEVSIRDQEASPRMATAILNGPDLLETLTSVAQADRFGESRSLASRCALALGDPDPLVNSFKDELSEPYWKLHWASLRASCARGQQAADAVFASFAAAYGRLAGAEFFKFLAGIPADEIGQSPEQVAVGLVPVAIVPKLESNDLASRVMGSLALDEAIEPIRRPFNPTARATDRRSSLRVLKNALEDEEVMPKSR